MTKKQQGSKDHTKDQNSPDSISYSDIADAIRSGKPLIGIDGLFSDMLKRGLEAALSGELDAHLEGSDVATRSNGLSSKHMQSSLGSFELEVPRDRASSFEPQIVRKRQTILTDELDTKILALYGIGNSYSDISSHLKDIYGVDISEGSISKVTDRLLPELNEWRNRPLEKTYPIVFLDAMFFRMRKDGKVINQAVYSILAINPEGKKDILGIYTAESEGANFWLSVLSDLQARGLEDIFIACVDGLKGFPEAINAVFPKTEVQLCVVHQIRNSIKYVSHLHKKEFISDLKQVYQAANKEVAESKLLELQDKWQGKYRLAVKSWVENWDLISNYFKYPPDLRKVIYTTNSVESYHRMIRKYTKSKGNFTSENALLKLVYAAIINTLKKWTMPVQNWSLIISQIDIAFEGRL